jgi:hypothetical protein
MAAMAKISQMLMDRGARRTGRSTNRYVTHARPKLKISPAIFTGALPSREN